MNVFCPVLLTIVALIDPVYPSEVLMFPPRDAILLQIQFNIAHGEWLQEQIKLHPHDSWYYQEWISENLAIRDVYNTLDSAWFSTNKCYSLRQLRDKIGREAYYSGRLPPCVPIWRFSRIP